MSPKRRRMQAGDQRAARSRRQIAQRYLDMAELLSTEDDGASINACIGNAVLSGIASSDAICLASTGERYAGQDHTEAARVLRQIDAESGKRLSDLVSLKTASHYGDRLLRKSDRDLALRRATALIETARLRTT